jgi:hypothetical protein
MYMFQAIPFSSSGGQIVLIQHLVSSLSVNDLPVHPWPGRRRVRFTLRPPPPPPPPGTKPRYPLSRWLIELQVLSRRFGGEKWSHSCYIPRFLAFGLVTIRPTPSNTLQLFRRNCVSYVMLLDSPSDGSCLFLSGQWSKGPCFRTRWRKQTGFRNGTFKKKMVQTQNKV